MVILLLSISFYGNLTVIDKFLWYPYYGIRLIFKYLSIITLFQQLDEFNQFIEFNENFWKNSITWKHVQRLANEM